MIDITLAHERGDFRLDIDLSVAARGIIGLIGRSGSGKSTLFSCIAGHIRPRQGHIRVHGRPLFCSAERINVPAAKRNIGVVFQEGLLFPHMNVERNLAFGARRTGSILWHEVIETLELAPLLRARPAHLSGGERQRAAIARALMAEPDLLLLDEPVSALDPALKARTLDLISRVQERTRTPMILISHSTQEVRRLCDQVITLSGGRIRSVVGVDEPGWAATELIASDGVRYAT